MTFNFIVPGQLPSGSKSPLETYQTEQGFAPRKGGSSRQSWVYFRRASVARLVSSLAAQKATKRLLVGYQLGFVGPPYVPTILPTVGTHG